MTKNMQRQKFDERDVRKNKPLAIMGYVFPILFFVPFITASKGSPFARFHANQQLILFLFEAIGYFSATALLFVYIGILLFPVVGIFSMFFMAIGILNAYSGLPKKLPVIGGFAILNRGPQK